MCPLTTSIAALRPRVHVIGLGSIGTFTAHSISEIASAPTVTLLLHRRSLLQEYRLAGSQIRFESRDGKKHISQGYEIETLSDGQWLSSPSGALNDDCRNVNRDPISNLVVCVKATQTESAIRSLANRLNRDSNILFLQNGAGMIEAINDRLFTDPHSRPNYLIGVISHGVTLNKSFDITHTGFSATSLGPVPRDSLDFGAISKSQSNYLLDILPQSTTLNATSYFYTDILQIQLEKLAVNAFCNPVCALNDAKNEFLFTVPELRRAILQEISQVVLSLPELKGVVGLEERFSAKSLEATVNMIITKTAKTTCSMVWDLRAERETEINFINGFWCRMGRKVGVKTPVNEQLVRTILERCSSR
ncbi:2-dehydropantoate 2-reductase (Ketopantoate reductase) (KPA reductase) (KPR) [Penicillium macrosclerotiorum]|uniref:2-dehydropantoate 2-reductase (Ketopantoate reductase) (KPA reductase) (KPR) n=1 Tax=Penicillium macrosclerotiorum TaxID=303699 RepID=UPI002546D779|nr:2-dehydropantoate 2-reductase (Ketopantoate reductase) (KPA reductase) (KPR) [Penicillium macrosclerotiorum]KAJ5693153.1 2-dehydropantoate 2-reductase (Ketopantoate reductase) (KPA reductase) (KPR) [Penicillium macrosclerotiorum]